MGNYVPPLYHGVNPTSLEQFDIVKPESGSYKDAALRVIESRMEGQEIIRVGITPAWFALTSPDGQASNEELAFYAALKAKGFQTTPASFGGRSNPVLGLLVRRLPETTEETA